jgi:hypothetical protein
MGKLYEMSRQQIVAGAYWRRESDGQSLISSRQQIVADAYRRRESDGQN